MKFRRISGLVGALAATAAFAPAADAAPVVTQATGPNTASIQAAVDQFRNDLGANNAGGPPAQSGRRQIAWDGVPDGRAAPSFMPEDQFRNLGALFSTPGVGFEVSGDDDSDNGSPDADPGPGRVHGSEPELCDAFAPFSPERLFAPIGSQRHGDARSWSRTPTPPPKPMASASCSATSISAGPTKLELLAADGESLGICEAPATAGNESVLVPRACASTPASAIALARITTGAAPLGNDDVTQGGAADIVVMDDFIYGEPQATPAVRARTARHQGPAGRGRGREEEARAGRSCFAASGSR